MSPMLKPKTHSFRPVLRLGITSAAVALTTLGACNPYERRVGEYNAGAVDPLKFPAAYLGDGGKGNKPGQGSFQFQGAFVAGKPLAYYPLPFNGKQDTATDPNGMCIRYADPLLIGALSIPLTYIFDPSGDDPSADSSKCMAPDGYMFDQQRDAVHFDRQGNIFTKLPLDTDPVGCTKYVPIVNQVTVASNGNPCQDIKSEATLVTRPDVSLNLVQPPPEVTGGHATGVPTNHYLAYAVIDPAADVLLPDMMHDPMTMLGTQRWGWYQQYLLAYLDGGEIPVDNSTPDKPHFATQKLYYPLAWDAMGKAWVDNGFGAGRDVMEHKRGDANYSPICEVYSFQPTDTDPDKSETTAEDIAKLMPPPESTGQYMYCLQNP